LLAKNPGQYGARLCIQIQRSPLSSSSSFCAVPSGRIGGIGG
jgi:hypothetical protein